MGGTLRSANVLAKANPATGDRGARQKTLSWRDGAEHKPSHFSRQAAIRADLIGSDICTALGLTINSSSPVLALCRALIEAGHDPATPLEAYRGETPCLRIRSIGEAAALEINAYGTGFRPRREADAAPPVRQNRRVA